jgi:hypothetical protein
VALLVPEVLGLLIVDAVVLALLVVALPTAVRVHLRWSFPAADRAQLARERRAELAAAIVGFALLVKVPAAALYLYAVDGLAERIVGAMCGVGVLGNGRDAGVALGLRVLVLFLLVAWRRADRLDRACPDLPYTRPKFTLLLVIFVAVALEGAFTLSFFGSLQLERIASCCGSVFGAAGGGATALLAGVPQPALAAAAAAVFAALLLAARGRRGAWFGALSVLFALLGAALVVGLTSPYVFALPTHRCPFCLLHAEYAGVGWLLFGLLLAGTTRGAAIGFARGVLRADPGGYRGALVSDGLFLALALAFPLAHVVRHGVWL